MIFVLPILSIVIVVLTSSFVLRQGLAIYREKKAIAVFALGISLITYVVSVLVARLAGLEFMGLGLANTSNFEQWIFLRQTITTIHSLLPLAFILYFVALVRRDLQVSTTARSRFKESASLSALAFLFAASGLFLNI